MTDEDLRIERKLLFDGRMLGADEVIIMLDKIGSIRLSSPFPSRVVNNIYFDTPGFDFLRLGVEGAYTRSKIRLRWYTEVASQRAEVAGQVYLEKKIRVGDYGYKRILPLVNLPTPLPISVFLGLPEIKGCPNLHNLNPTLVNLYRRDYFEIFKGQRVTVDREICFLKPDLVSEAYKRFDGTIIEFKYTDDNGADQIEYLIRRYRSTKLSKYILGMNYVGF